MVIRVFFRKLRKVANSLKKVGADLKIVFLILYHKILTKSNNNRVCGNRPYAAGSEHMHFGTRGMRDGAARLSEKFAYGSVGLEFGFTRSLARR